MVSLAERYESGACREVWDELVALGPAVFERAHLAEAEAVAALTMERAATNIATIVVRLTLMGYRFGNRFNRNLRRRTIEDLGLRDSMADAGRDMSWYDAGEVEEHLMGWEPPDEEVKADIERAEHLFGPLPVSYRALVRDIDAVDLSGSFPAWDPSAYEFDEPGRWPEFGVHSDPLNFSGISTVLEVFRPSVVGADPSAQGFALPLGANHLLSANQPGDFHHLTLPDCVADPVIEGVYGRPGIRLVEYLRVAFEWGGFPGFAFADRVPREIDVLHSDLLPI